MNPKFVGFSVFAVIVSFIGGFMLANSLNKTDMSRSESLKTNVSNASAQNQQNQGDETLTSEEITQRIGEADQNPTNISYQKELGIALYKYAGMKQDADVLLSVTRLLNRVYEANPKDEDVLIALGNCYFDGGLIKKDNAIFQKSRKYYEEALKLNPNDLDVVADIGLIYALSVPPEHDKAIAEFQKALKKDPDHVRSLQSIVQSLVYQKDIPEAEKFLARLEKVSPQNPRIPDLKAQIAGQPSNLSK